MVQETSHSAVPARVVGGVIKFQDPGGVSEKSGQKFVKGKKLGEEVLDGAGGAKPSFFMNLGVKYRARRDWEKRCRVKNVGGIKTERQLC